MSALAAALAVFMLMLGWSAAPPAHAADLPDGSTVWIGSGGTLLPIYLETPADPANPGVPDLWAYCIEHDVGAETLKPGTVGNWASFPGENYFPDADVAAAVGWIVANSYPAISLEQLRADIAFPGLTEAGAIEGTQYAIWRFTELTYDATWSWDAGTGSEELYWHLLAGAHASGGLSEDDLQAHVSLTGPAAAQQAPGLIGPILVATDQPSAAITVEPAFDITDSSGTPIDPNAVVDGQELYIDARSTYAPGSATVTATVAGSAGAGKILTVAADDPQDDHAQTLILVAAAGSTNDSSVEVAFSVPEPRIGTAVAVQGSAAKVLPLTGGTVIDTVSYEGLVPGETYVLTGEVRTAPAGAPTGITATAAFTADAASGTAAVTFQITAGQVAAYAGQDLVVFEYLTLEGVPVAEHTDPTDGGQTFTVAAAPAATTTTTVATTVPQSDTTTPAGVLTTTTVAAVPAVPSVPTDQLPVTGSSSMSLLVVAAAVLVVGGGAVLLARRTARTR